MTGVVDATTPSSSAGSVQGRAGADSLIVERGEGFVRVQGMSTCPDGFPIKGNTSSGTYHTPSDASYQHTIPEVCFASEEAAVANGYRAPSGRGRRDERQERGDEDGRQASRGTVLHGPPPGGLGWLDDSIILSQSRWGGRRSTMGTAAGLLIALVLLSPESGEERFVIHEEEIRRQAEHGGQDSLLNDDRKH